MTVQSCLIWWAPGEHYRIAQVHASDCSYYIQWPLSFVLLLKNTITVIICLFALHVRIIKYFHALIFSLKPLLFLPFPKLLIKRIFLVEDDEKWLSLFLFEVLMLCAFWVTHKQGHPNAALFTLVGHCYKYLRFQFRLNYFGNLNQTH